MSLNLRDVDRHKNTIPDEPPNVPQPDPPPAPDPPPPDPPPPPDSTPDE